MVRAAGAKAQLMAKANYATIKLPSGEVRKVRWKLPLLSV